VAAMQETFDTMRAEMAKRLRAQNVTAEPDAFSPMRRISFKKLVSIHDHEEVFLKDVFLESLITVHGARTRQSSGNRKVNSEDVRTALKMLGQAALNAHPTTFSRKSGLVLVSICPWC
jgi:hypothetical protein